MTPVPRVGGRLLVLDPAGQILLIHERIEHDQRHWLTPGGGLEPGESPVRAACRETFEETGLHLDLPEDSASVLVTRRNWSWAGVSYDQVDHFFLARVAAGVDVAPRALTAMEQDTLIGHRWWSIAELRATSEVVVPADLAAVLTRVIGTDG